jgi:imidazole glycerol-phosphate synthase subunit HisH
MIAVIDYGMGNLRSVQKALERSGARTRITQSGDVIESAEKVVLPGVGAIRPAMAKLNALGLVPVIKKTISDGKPFLGICLGLQLLFERSDEGGRVNGIGIFQGTVDRFPPLRQKATDFSLWMNGPRLLAQGSNLVSRALARGAPKLKVPQMGWNRLCIRQQNNPFLRGVNDGDFVYFCHSYYVNPVDKNLIAATTDYGCDFASAIGRGNLFAVQFHPEKSQAVGLKILENFVRS